MHNFPPAIAAYLDDASRLGFEISSYRPGAIASVIDQHMEYYAPNWGFGQAFEAKLAEEMGAFLRRYDPRAHLFLCLWKDGGLAGTITIDGDHPDGPRLRWFITSDTYRGRGVGKLLMGAAMEFADDLDVSKPCWLTTFAGLDAAAKMYLRHDFRLVHQSEDDQWNSGVREQRYERSYRNQNPNL